MVTDLERYEPAGELSTSRVDRWDVEVEKWLLSKDSTNTRRSYRMTIRQWKRWCLDAGGDPWKATRTAVNAWREHLDDDGAAPKTIAQKLSAVASFYTWLVEEDLIPVSPAVHVRRPKVGSSYAATIALDERELAAVIRTAEARKDRRDYVAVLLQAETGIRSRELLTARFADRTVDHGENILDVTRKGGKRDRVTMPGWVAEQVDLLQLSRDSEWIIGRGKLEADYLWLWRMYERIGLDSGVSKRRPDSTIERKLTPHVLRATYATIAFDEGVPQAYIQDAMGHADPRTTGLYDRGRGKQARRMQVTNAVDKHIPRPKDH